MNSITLIYSSCSRLLRDRRVSILITKDYSITLTEVTVLPAGDPKGIEDSPVPTLKYFLTNHGTSPLDVSLVTTSSVMVSYDKPDVIPLSSVTVLNPETDYYKTTIMQDETSSHYDAYKLENLTDPVTLRFHDASDENFELVGTTTINVAELAEDSSQEDISSLSTPDSQQPAVSSETVTMGQRNALSKAKDYLEVMPFSYTGLIKQLEYEKYTHKEAIYGADHCGADWNEQAVKFAKSYLDLMDFSRDGLIEQLEYEGFTNEQAIYGVEANGF